MKVSVVMLAYNHEKYIREAIEGVLNQKTNFDFELILGEDFSTDSTRKICEEYSINNTRVNLLPSPKNYGLMENYIRTLKETKGEYIALCSGDDFWIDDMKLQIQIDFLENNSNYSMSFHAVNVLDSINHKKNNLFEGLRDADYSGKDIFPSWQVPASSVVFRAKHLNKIIERLINPNFCYEDIITYLTLAEFGKLRCISKKMAVYRIHGESISNMAFNEERINMMNKHLDEIAKDFGGKYKKSIEFMRHRKRHDDCFRLLKKRKLKGVSNFIILLAKEPLFSIEYIAYRFNQLIKS